MANELPLTAIYNINSLAKHLMNSEARNTFFPPPHSSRDTSDAYVPAHLQSMQMVVVPRMHGGLPVTESWGAQGVLPLPLRRPGGRAEWDQV